MLSIYEGYILWKMKDLRFSEDRKFNYMDLGREGTIETLMFNKIARGNCGKTYM